MRPANATVLIVDDDRLMREMLSDYLSAEAFSVETAPSGEEGLARVAQGGVGVVVADLMMPGMGGLEVLERLRLCEESPAAIVLTSYGTVESAVRALRAGAFDYLQKPVGPEALRASVLRALEARLIASRHPSISGGVALHARCQRLLHASSRDELVLDAFAALLSATSSEGAMLVSWEWGEADRRVAARGLTDDVATELGRRLEEVVVTSPVDAPTVMSDPRGRPCLVLPISRAEVSALLVAVGGEGARFDAAAVERGALIADHLSFGLYAAQRVAEAASHAFVDELTGLYNARYFDVMLARELGSAQAVDTATPRPLSLLFVDVDQASYVNERFGHMTGSKVLVEMGRVLRRCVREVDPVFRHGGDDFAVLLRGADVDGALHVAERIRRSVESHPFLSREGLDLRLTISAGVSSFPAHATSRERLVDLAESALHRGKRGGRNAVHVASEEIGS